jgi:integrase
MVGTVVRVKGIKRYREPKTGKVYCYHRATGIRIDEPFGSGEFFTRLAELDAKARKQAEDKAKPDSLKALILDYKQSDNFGDLAPRTKSDYEKVFAFLEPIWNASVSSLTAPKLVKLRNEWRTMRGRHFVNYIRAVLSVLFNHAIEMGIIDSNPTQAVRRIRPPRDAESANRPWSLSERKAALTHLPSHIKLPIAIGLFTGMREGDVLKLPRTIVRDGCIAVTTSKRKVAIDITILPDLQHALEEAPQHDAITLCANSRGKPWTTSGFRASWRKARLKLEQRGLIEPGLTFHGLRHTVATVLAEAGVSEEDIAAVLGQKSSKMASHYSRLADRSRRSKAAIEKFKPLENSG